MRALGAAVTGEHTVYMVGGATAVLHGWRDGTVDIDLSLGRGADEILRAIPEIKNRLQLNVELASPGDFIPLPDGWEDRAISIGREGTVTFLHFDPYAQALAKLERGHDRDLEDVESMLDTALVDPARLGSLFSAIEDELYRFPAIDPAGFRRRVTEAIANRTSGEGSGRPAD